MVLLQGNEATPPSLHSAITFPLLSHTLHFIFVNPGPSGNDTATVLFRELWDAVDDLFGAWTGVAIGYPHCGQAYARSDTSLPHSGHLIRAIGFPPFAFIFHRIEIMYD